MNSPLGLALDEPYHEFIDRASDINWAIWNMDAGSRSFTPVQPEAAQEPTIVGYRCALAPDRPAALMLVGLLVIPALRRRKR